MGKAIHSVEIITQCPDGPGMYYVGQSIGVGVNRPVIDDIIEINGTFFIYDKDDNLLKEIRNCPVVVNYKYESEE